MNSPNHAQVLFVESYPQVIAGQQRTLLSLLSQWDSKLADAVVMTPGGGVYVDKLRSLDHLVWEFPQPARLSRYGGAIYDDGFVGKLRNGTQGVAYLRQLRKALQDKDVRAVFCNDMRGLLTVGVAARSLGIPVMIWDKLDKPHGWLDRIELPLVNRVAIISEAVLSKFSSRQCQRYRDKISLVPNGADLTQFDGVPADRARFEISSDQIAIGLVGTVCHRKAQDRVLKILPQLLQTLPNAVVLIAGSWTDSEEDRQYFESLPFRDHPQVRFLGQRSDIPTLMQSLDIFVLASRYEGMGQVTAEAMACRLPVVGARAGGIPEVVVDGETGLIFDGDSPDHLLECLARLGSDADLRKQMGNKGRLRVEREYNRPVQMQKICKLLEDLVH
ncbi:GDP-mannose-dependent alpha-(1-6)-phosphatidylinositol monomannoside mannosyltransferase [Rosistilla oblonga]|uniref:glycosyltransferase family 4 protein n=1 Tax=Rosistilla oblonga TaxID=2527990 RepID=UPI0011880C16|nr:glycosyltransferase family 4 protein [Rosistilla oblonga]QDV12550.1 GDP-mannose-dependent alpha-(1-6)-phosphatidylinositol monomannoside mannosyltransferase [Rosistilla oblonga]